MKRRILLLMMTALLSVGAWAQSLWTKTLFEGSQIVTSSDPQTNSEPLIIERSKLQGARIGSQICIYLSLSGEAQYGYNINYYGDNGWKQTWSGKGDNLVVSAYIDNDILTYDNPLKIYAHNQDNTTPTCTVTKVTLTYNGVNLTSNFGANMYDPNSGAFQLKKSVLTNASEGDILQVSVSSENEKFNSGWHMLSLTNGQGNFESMGEATNVYNEAPESYDVILEGSSNFSDITIGSLLTFNTTVEGLKAESGETTLYDHMWYCENQTVFVTDDNINTIKANGIKVTVNKLKDDGNTLTVTKANPSGTIAYWRTNNFSAGSTVNIPLTSALLGHAREGDSESEGNLYLGGYGFTASSVDLIYQPSTVTIGSTGYATFGYPFAVDLSGLSASQDAYTVSVSGTTATLTSVKDKKIPAGTGIILKGSNGDAISLPLTTASTNEIGTNNLHVSDGTVTGDGNTIYVLANGSKGVGFYLKKSGSAIAAGKAYLSVSGGVANARAFIGFDDNDGKTGIDEVRSNTEEVRSDYYDLQGRRVDQPTKGLYIVNGKKVIIK